MPKGKPSKASTARNRTDDMFRHYVRERDGWKCQRCRKNVFQSDSPMAHVMHNFSRRHPLTRCHPDNAALGCAACHFLMTGDHYEHVKFFTARLGGEENVLAMRRLAMDSKSRVTEQFWLDVQERLGKLMLDLESVRGGPVPEFSKYIHKQRKALK